MSGIPEPIEGIFEEIKNEILWLHVKRIIYRQLFAHSSKRIDLLNKCASVAFYIFEGLLLDEILMSLSKLTDPARIGKAENLTFDQLQKQIEDLGNPGLSCQLRNILEDLRGIPARPGVPAKPGKCDAIRIHRNKRLAHFDRETAMQQGANLDPVSLDMIEAALALVREYMNTIERHYGDSDTEYEQVLGMSMKDGDALVAWLKDGLDFSEIAKKLKRGRNELRSGKWSDA